MNRVPDVQAAQVSRTLLRISLTGLLILVGATGCAGAGNTDTTPAPATTATAAAAESGMGSLEIGERFERELTTEDAARGIPGIPTGQWSMFVYDGYLAFVAPDGGRVEQGVSISEDGTIEMGAFEEGGKTACDDPTAPGLYAIARDGDEVTITIVDDPECQDRTAIVPGTWELQS